MAIARMTKIMIVTHRTEAVQVLEALQQAGTVQVLDAQKAMVTKEWPELQVESRRPKDLEEMVARLEKAVVFLKDYTEEEGGTSLFSPRVPVTGAKYAEVVSGKQALELLDRAEVVEKSIDQLAAESENLAGRVHSLEPWAAMETPVQALRELTAVSASAGLLPHQHFDETAEALVKLGAAIQQVGSTGNMHACIIASPRDIAADVQKILRSSDFEAVTFEGMSGRVSDLLAGYQQKLANIERARADAKKQASEIAKERLSLQILHDHYRNLLNREVARANAPATETVVLLEGWVKRTDLKRLQKLMGRFAATTVSEIEPAEGEEPPVEIDNVPAVQPFEVITRLYGMPHSTDVDPTVFLAPFFALFFGICLTDAAYGLVMIGILWWLLKKIKGDKRFFYMLIACSVMTVIAGALTGGWAGDMVQKFGIFNGGTPAVIDTPFERVRDGLMWFDPMEKPMYFFTIALALGYLQIIFGIAVGFYAKWRRGDYRGAVFDHLTWFIWLNSLAVFGVARAGLLPSWVATIALYIAIVPAVGILLFSERQGPWGARVGMGCYNLFSTVFYVGDVLSYIRLMALGMVTGGFGMAINQITAQTMEVPYVGWLIGGIIFVGGHLFNIANSALGSFVHSMRLQFVEFFTKFMAGGGTEFAPLKKDYSHIQVSEDQNV